MKKTLIIIFACILTLNLFAQRDTTVVIVEKNADYIYFRDYLETTDKYNNYNSQNSGQTFFSISIKCHYYDDDPNDEWFARIELDQMKKGFRNWEIDDYEITIHKNDLHNFKTVSAETINKSKDIMEISRLIGLYANEKKVIYVVFKRDLKHDTITLYRVTSGANLTDN